MKTPESPNTKLDRKGVLMKTEESVLKAKLTDYLYRDRTIPKYPGCILSFLNSQHTSL